MYQLTFMAMSIFVISFLLGSIPFGLFVSKLRHHDDIRKHGSGNIGATNAMRTFGAFTGTIVFLLDFAKGLFAALISAGIATPLLSAAGGHATVAVGAASYADMLALSFMAVVAGHVFSPWLQGRGGKGVSCAIGSLFVVFGWQAALLEIAIFAVLAVATRYVSLGSIMASVACPFFALVVFWGDWTAVALCALGAAIIVWAHRGNLRRLKNGTESRFSLHGSKTEGR